MKKGIIFAGLLALNIGLIAGCGKKEPEAPTTKETISVSINTSVKAPNAMSKDELLALSPAAIKEMVETYLPNYRAIYNIPDDKEMTDEDYISLRDLICDQLYGVEMTVENDEHTSNVNTSGIDFSHPDKIVGDDGSYLDPNWIYYAPCEEYVAGLTDDRFKEYLLDLMKYWNKDDITEENLKNLDEDTLDSLRKMVYDDFCVEWGSVYIPTVNELANEEETASVMNTAINESLKTAFDRYKQNITEAALLEEGKEYTEEERNSIRDYVASFKNSSLSDTDAMDIYSEFTITAETGYDEFMEMYRGALSSQNWTAKDENGNVKETIENTDIEKYIFDKYIKEKYADSLSVSDNQATE